MSDENPDFDSFEERIRELAREVRRSVERMEEFDIEDVAQAFGVDPDRARDFVDSAGRWLAARAGNLDLDASFWTAMPGRETSDSPSRPSGPHPLDMPTEPQGLALSALASGRWTVEPGSNVLASSEGPSPGDARELVGELRARDWVAADGTVTAVGHNALTRWMESAKTE